MKPLVSDLSNSVVPNWQHDFTVAVRSGQIQAAKAAIFLRLKAKVERPPGILERIALNDAIDLLRALRSGHVSNADSGSVAGA
jgi:hypothetical protein